MGEPDSTSFAVQIEQDWLEGPKIFCFMQLGRAGRPAGPDLMSTASPCSQHQVSLTKKKIRSV